MAPDLLVRRARTSDAPGISRLNNTFADEGQMLARTPETVALAIDDYVVVQNAAGELLACGALKEYSPSVAEVAAIAVSRDAHGKGLGRAIVGAVERLARQRGIHDLFALTLQPEFSRRSATSASTGRDIRRRSVGTAWAARAASRATRSASPGRSYPTRRCVKRPSVTARSSDDG